MVGVKTGHKPQTIVARRMIPRRKGKLSALGNSLTELKRRKYNKNTFVQHIEVLLLQSVARVHHYNKDVSSLRCIIFLVCGHQGKWLPLSTKMHIGRNTDIFYNFALKTTYFVEKEH